MKQLSSYSAHSNSSRTHATPARTHAHNTRIALYAAFLFLGVLFSTGSAFCAEGTLTITRTCFPSGTLAYSVTDAWSATASTGGTISGYGDIYSTKDQTTLQTKEAGVSSHYYNTTILPGAIKSITVDVASGTDRVYNVYASATASISSTTGLSIIGTVSGGCSLDLSTAYGYKYFALVCTGGASYLNDIVITYETSPESVIFSRVSSLSELEDGDEIIFVNQAEDAACSLIQNTNNRGTKSISVNGDHQYTYSASDSVQIFTVKIDNGNYGFHTKAGYIYSANSSNNHLKTNTANICSNPSSTSAWTLSVSSNVFTIQNATNTAYYIQFSGSTFSQYSTSQTKPFIFKHFSPHTVSWETNGDEWTEGSPTTSGVIHGSKVTTLPTAPTSPDCDDSKVFVGWSATPIVGETNTKPSDLFTTIAGSPAITDDVTFYAVFATSGSVTKTFSFDITPSNFTTKSYDDNNTEKTTTATATDASGVTTEVNWSSYQVMKSSSDIQFQKGAGYICNNTDLGTVNSVTYTASAGTLTTWYGTTEHPTSGSQGSGKGYCTVKETGNSAAGKTTSITVNFTKTVTVYSEYATNCEAASLESITVKTAPTKTVYCEGEDFDPTGLVITLHYDDKSTTDLPYAGNSSNFSFSPSEDLQDDNEEVTISCGGQSVTQSISVHDPYTITLTNNGSADHGSFTADVLSSCEGETITLTATPNTHYSLSSWTITKEGGGEVTPDGNTFVMPEDNVTINASFTENAYKIVSFANNRGLITSYTDIKVYVGERPTPPTLTDGVSNDACDGTSDKHYGWTRTAWSNTIDQSAIDAKTAANVKVYRKGTRLPIVSAGDPSSIIYHAVWAEGTMTAGQLIGYELVDEDLDDWSGYYVLSTGTYTATGEYSSNSLTCDDWDPTEVNYEYNREFIIAKIGETSNYSIKLPDDSKYIGYSGSNTNLVQDDDGPDNATPSTAEKYPWTMSTDGIVNVNTITRQLAIEDAISPTKFKAYTTTNVGTGTNAAVKLYKRKIGTGLVYSKYRTCCGDLVISSNNTDFSGYARDVLSSSDVHITNGATLTITTDALSVNDLYVEGGATLNIDETAGGDGVTFSVNSLSLQGGWTTIGGDSKYDMPRVYINPLSTLSKTEDDVNFDISVDANNYYPFAVPFEVEVANVDYANSTLATASVYGTHYVIKEYDGENRAKVGAVEANWKIVEDGTVYGESSATLQPGKGYILTAVSIPAYGGGVIRFPMSFSNAWTALGERSSVTSGLTTTTKNEVSVTAYSGSVATANKCHAGWNMLGVPFMSCYGDAGGGMYGGDAVLLEGKMVINAGKIEFEDDDVKYVTVPVHDFSEYIQVDITDDKAELRPGWSFFVQIGTTGTLSFLTANEQTNSDLPIYAPKRKEAENMPTVKTGIVLSSETASDKTTFLISDKYSDEYEIGADLEKMFGNGYTLATYSLNNDTRLAFNAMSTNDAKSVIPVGIRIPADGSYTFSLNERYADADIERIDLIDYETNTVTNLTAEDYTFNATRSQNDERFAINITPRAQTPTDIGDTGIDDTNGVRKILLNETIYIIRDGRVYDATGKRVTTINK